MTDFVVRPILKFGNNWYPYHLRDHERRTEAMSIVMAQVGGFFAHKMSGRTWAPIARRVLHVQARVLTGLVTAPL